MTSRMRRGSTHFLRFFIFLLGAAVLALCVFALPSMSQGGAEEFPEARLAVFLIVAGLYASALPFFLALWQALKLLDSIDRNTAFSESSVTALRNIKRCAIVISAIYAAFLPLLLPIGAADDAPGLLVFGAALAFVPVTVAVFAAVLERLLRNAIEIKSENDLTV